MSEAKTFKNKVQFLLLFLIVIGIIATTIISSVSWKVSQNLTSSIEALGNNTKLLSDGNLALSNTIANYIDRQERIATAKSQSDLQILKDKSEIANEFTLHFDTLVNNLAGLDLDEAKLLRAEFANFNRYDDSLFALKEELFNLDNSVTKSKDRVAELTYRTKLYANNLANKVRAFEKKETGKANELSARDQSFEDDSSAFDDFWYFEGGDDEEEVSDEALKNIAKENNKQKLKEAKRIKNVLVDKNTNGLNTKSLISLHIKTLERTTQKLLLATTIDQIQEIKTSEILPEINKLNKKLNSLQKANISVDDFDAILKTIVLDIKTLKQELTGSDTSLFSNKYNLIMQAEQFGELKVQLNETRSELLNHLEKLSQSGDLLAKRTSEQAAGVVQTSREYIIGIGIGVLFIFVIIGLIIARNINRMAEKIQNQSDEMAKAHKIITAAHSELQESNGQITESIQYASKIQQAIQSSEIEFSSFCHESFVIWQPRDIVGGDMYLVRNWGAGKIIVFFDCTGHGVPGAFMTILAKAALDKALQIVKPTQTGDLISTMHKIIQVDLDQNTDIGTSDDGLDIGVCYIPNDRNELFFSGARLSLIYYSNETIKEIKGDKSSIGYRNIRSDVTFTDHKIDLYQNTQCYLFTDGIIDQVGGKKTISFGRRRLLKLIEKYAKHPMSEQAKIFTQELDRYQGTEDRRDDVTLLGFTLVPKGIDTNTHSKSRDTDLVGID